MCSTRCPCLSDAHCSVQPDDIPGSRLQVLMGKAEMLSDAIARVRKKAKEDGDHFPNFRILGLGLILKNFLILG